jgi:hypothetical protein
MVAGCNSPDCAALHPSYACCTGATLLKFFARTRPAVQEITPDVFMGDHGPSIFFVASLQMLPFSQEPNSALSFRASINEFGFGPSWLRRFSSEPPRASQFDMWCTDRFFSAHSGKSRGGSLASVEIDEARVYDGRMRSELDYTGFRVSVTLREEAFRPFLTYLVSRESAEKLRSPMFAVRMPSKPFAFLELRGNPDVWSGGFSYTRKLKPIKRFKVDEFSVAILEYKTPHREWSPGSAVYERYNVLSAQQQWLEAQ